VDERSAEALAACGLSLADAIEGREPAPAALPPDPRAERLSRLRAELDAAAAGGRDVPGLARSLREAERHVVAAEAAAREHADRARGVDRDRVRRATALLRPGGAPQERVLSPVSVVARHGREVLREGLALLDPLADGTQVVRVG
jgi:hypothetical protein